MGDYVYHRPDYSEKQNLSIYTATRYFCMDCTCNQPTLIERCPDDGCPLWRFRFGMNPATAERKGKNVHGLRGGAAPKKLSKGSPPIKESPESSRIGGGKGC